MTWALWFALLGFVTSASVAAVSAYVAWSFRYRYPWVGTTTEVALAAAIVFGIAAAFVALAERIP